jgi:hypothetical protein
MKTILWSALLACPAVQLFGQTTGESGSGTPRHRLRAGVLDSRIELDGRLLDSAWARADSIDGLTQVTPVEGGPARSRTVVKVLVNAREILFGIVAYGASEVPIISYSKARDADLDDEDNIQIVIDGFQDGRSGYFFAVNPSGARVDGLPARQGEDLDENWDGIWEAATAQDGNTWSAEIRIPVRTIIFRPGLTAWGFNIQREVKATQEITRWNSPAQNIRVTQTSRAGLLEGLPEFSLGLGLSIRPAISGGGGHPGPGSELDGSFKPSLDVTERVGSNLLASLTVNTDFAETEVDSRRTNLTRFPLFFPEKRSFFLEGVDIFEFGPNLGEEVIPFFSRRIGLLDGRSVPLVGGLKLNGRAGQSGFGALLSRTGRVDGLAEPELLSAARFRQSVLGESSVGLIATTGDPRGRKGAWTAGADAIYHTSRFRGNKNLTIGGWYARVGRDSLNGTRDAFGLLVDYPNDVWDIAASWKRIGDDFDPSLGFVPRRGIHRYRLSVNYQPRPHRWGIRQMFFEQSYELVTDLEGQWESYRIFLAPINWRLESGDRFEANVVPQGERLVEPFEIVDGVVIPPTSYRFTRYRLEVETAAHRQVSAQATWWFGRFYDGHLHELQLEGAWRPSSQMSLELEVDHNVGRLSEGAFTTTVVEASAKINFSPNLTLSSLIQYDTESRSWGSNTRVRWSFSPLGDVFLVYNHNLRDFQNRLEFESNQLLLKAQYTLRH